VHPTTANTLLSSFNTVPCFLKQKEIGQKYSFEGCGTYLKLHIPGKSNKKITMIILIIILTIIGLATVVKRKDSTTII